VAHVLSRDTALTGKIALVTGGGTGIGRTIALRFAAAGAHVVVVGRRRGPIEDVAGQTGGWAVQADVSQEADVERVFAECDARQGGRLDVLVNNAGIPGPIANAADMSAAAWDEIIGINIRGVMLCTRAAIPRMIRGGGGAIVNLSSLLGLRGYPMRSAYAATKFAVIGMTECVAHEVGPYGIRVNALCPGAVHGELMDDVIARRAAMEGRSAEEVIKMAYTDVAALRKWVEPEEVAEAALFLASDASRAITGERMKVDAGRL
jgi:NAD(P)-dependent dehydrogenase (short-subunit alcohol dehydrogenase family)